MNEDRFALELRRAMLEGELMGVAEYTTWKLAEILKDLHSAIEYRGALQQCHDSLVEKLTAIRAHDKAHGPFATPMQS